MTVSGSFNRSVAPPVASNRCISRVKVKDMGVSETFSDPRTD